MPTITGTVTVAAAAVSVTVTGAFVAPYQVAEPSTDWLTDVVITSKTATSFVVTFGTPAPAGGGSLDYLVFDASGYVAGAGTTAADIINAVRDLIPDPVYSGTTPQPDTDGGLFRASTLYRWLNRLVQRAARTCGTIIDDWTALRQVANQPWYAVDTRFITIASGFSNQYRLNRISAIEEDTLWPGTGNASADHGQIGYLRRTGSGLTFGVWPLPDTTDPTTTLNGAITSTTNPITVVSTTGALSFGYAQIENEIVQYQSLTATTLAVVSRGVAGTNAASHADGVTVTFLGLWLKGARTPAPISSSTSIIELPADLIDLLEDALLSRCRTSEQEFAEGSRLMQAFDAECRRVKADPSRKESVGQIPAFGDGLFGPLVLGGRVVLPALIAAIGLAGAIP